MSLMNKTDQNRRRPLPFFFSSKGPYYMPKTCIDGQGGLRSTLARLFHAVTLFINLLVAWRGMGFFTSPSDFRHTKVPYYMPGSYLINYFGFQKISKNDFRFVCITKRKRA